MLPVIAIQNFSSVLSDDDAKRVIPALQHQVSVDFAAYWQIGATLVFLPKDQTPVPGWWQIVIVDDPDQAGALGYHELTAAGWPLGKVFAKLDIDSGSSWTVTLSHELLEMLGDPDIDTCKQAADGTMYALEVCDAVEADNLGYAIDGVQVSDFVTPRWFNDAVGGDRYSFMRRVSKPYQLAPGGYISKFDSKGWTQVNADALLGSQKVAAKFAQEIKQGSRRDRRTLRKTDWKRSTR